MSELIEKYEISVAVSASPERLKDIITDLEKIKIWEPSHRLPFVSHNWIPSIGKLKIGNKLIIKSLLWTFMAECKDITTDTVKWEFIGGPLKGHECWKIKPIEDGYKIIKVMDCSVTGLIDRIVWRIIGRRIHDWASLKQLKTIKFIAENQ